MSVDLRVVGHSVVSLVASVSELVSVVRPEVEFRPVVMLGTEVLVDKFVDKSVVVDWTGVVPFVIVVVRWLVERGSPSTVVVLAHLEVTRLTVVVVSCVLVPLHQVDDGT